jgi:hypothetical protein
MPATRMLPRVSRRHAQQVAIDRRRGEDQRPADRHLRPRPIPLELQWDVDRGEGHGRDKGSHEKAMAGHQSRRREARPGGLDKRRPPRAAAALSD